MSENHGVLTAQKGPLKVALFPDGSYTSDIAGARSGAVTSGLALAGPHLGRTDGERVNHQEQGQIHPTPSRVEALHRLVAQGVLPEEAAERLVSDGGVRDHAWEMIKGLASGRIDTATGLTLTTLECWTLSFQTAGVTRGFAFEPLDHWNSEVPYPAILETLDTLRSEGWRLFQMSEDRKVDVAAETSFIVAIRYLLVLD